MRLRCPRGSRWLGVWQRNFLWSAPSYLAGAALAAVATAAATRGAFGGCAPRAAALSRVPELSHRRRTAARGTGRNSPRDGRPARDRRSARAGHRSARRVDARSTSDRSSSTRACWRKRPGCPTRKSRRPHCRAAARHRQHGGPRTHPRQADAARRRGVRRVKIHPRVGAEILSNVPFGAPVADLVLCHHERWDGLGYPAGLRGDDIPVGARILAIADCYSTMQADRPYRPARNERDAIALLREVAGSAFDPALVDLLIARLTWRGIASGRRARGRRRVGAGRGDGRRCRTSPDASRRTDAL